MALPTFLPQQANIKAHWNLNEYSSGAAAVSRADDSGNNNTLTDNLTTESRPGKLGLAAHYDIAVGNSLSIADAAQTGLDILLEITISFLYYPFSFSNIEWFIQKWTGGGQASYGAMCGTGNKVRFLLSADGTALIEAFSLTALTTYKWWHVVCTLNPTTDLMQVYLQGIADGTAVSKTTDIFNSTTLLSVGSGSPNGLLDDVTIWDKCLTAAEILALYKYYTQSRGFLLFM